MTPLCSQPACIAILLHSTMIAASENNSFPLRIQLDPPFKSSMFSSSCTATWRIKDFVVSGKIPSAKFEIGIPVKFQFTVTNTCSECITEINAGSTLTCRETRGRYTVGSVGLTSGLPCNVPQTISVNLETIETIAEMIEFPNFRCSLMTPKHEPVIPKDSVHVRVPARAFRDTLQTAEDANLLLMGFPGVGKTTFVMTQMSALSEELVNLPNIGGSDKHVTTRVTKYSLPAYTDAKSLRINLWDTWGMTEDIYSSYFLRNLCQGNVPDRFEMSDEYNHNENHVPNAADQQMTAVLFFLRATQLQENKSYQLLKKMLEESKTLHYRALVVLTWLDQLGSENLEAYLNSAAKKLGIERRRVFAFHGYTSHRQRSYTVDSNAFMILQSAVQSHKMFTRLTADDRKVNEQRAEAQKAKRQREAAELESQRQQELAEKEAQRQRELAEKETQRQREIAEEEARRQREPAEKEAQHQRELAEKKAQRQREIEKCQACYMDCAHVETPPSAKAALVERDAALKEVRKMELETERRVVELNGRIIELEKERNRSDGLLLTSQVNAESCEARGKRLRERTVELESTRETAEKESTKANTEVAHLRHETIELKGKLNSLESANHQLQAQVSELKFRHESAEQQQRRMYIYLGICISILVLVSTPASVKRTMLMFAWEWVSSTGSKAASVASNNDEHNMEQTKGNSIPDPQDGPQELDRAPVPTATPSHKEMWTHPGESEQMKLGASAGVSEASAPSNTRAVTARPPTLSAAEAEADSDESAEPLASGEWEKVMKQHKGKPLANADVA